MASLNTSLPASHEKTPGHNVPAKAGSMVKQFGTAVALVLALHTPAYAVGGQETTKTPVPTYLSPDNTVEIEGKSYTYEDMFQMVAEEKNWGIVEKVRNIEMRKYVHIRAYITKRLNEDIAKFDAEGVIAKEKLAKAIAEREPITREYISQSYRLMDRIEKNPSMLENPKTRALLIEIIEDMKYIPEDLRNRGIKALGQVNYTAQK